MERLLLAAHVAVVQLRADLEVARQRLAAADAAAAPTEAVIGRVRSMVRAAQAEADEARDAALRTAEAAGQASEVAAARIVAAARRDNDDDDDRADAEAAA